MTREESIIEKKAALMRKKVGLFVIIVGAEFVRGKDKIRSPACGRGMVLRLFW